MKDTIGVVAIGRNEGERLRRCLNSIVGKAAHVVYVDSGSTDGSALLAEDFGAVVVELNLDDPFTAARARNAGWRRLVALSPGLAYVQFVDGDCEVVEGWLETACEALATAPQRAVVCGRRRERRPQASIYNRLCDMEWDTPIGEATYCGGDAMMRLDALQKVGGFDEQLIAGEEPELCFRLREAGYTVWRLDAEMTLHDAAMTRFSQWWKRAVRCGHAFAEGAAMHGKSPERYCKREVSSTLQWGAWVPLLAVSLPLWTKGWSLLLFAAYPVLMARAYFWQRRRGYRRAHAALYGVACVAAKFPQMVGAVRYYNARRTGKPRTLIEYK
jgi:GT2 family glycosyltransferase